MVQYVAVDSTTNLADFDFVILCTVRSGVGISFIAGVDCVLTTSLRLSLLSYLPRTHVPRIPGEVRRQLGDGGANTQQATRSLSQLRIFAPLMGTLGLVGTPGSSVACAGAESPERAYA